MRLIENCERLMRTYLGVMEGLSEEIRTKDKRERMRYFTERVQRVKGLTL